MPYKSLPSSPSLDHLKRQARDLQRALDNREPQAAQRIREFHPQFAKADDNRIFAAGLNLSAAQFTIAREHCCASWAKLKTAVEDEKGSNSDLPLHERIEDPQFRQAVELLDSGDATGLAALLRDQPALVRQRVFFNIGSYFGNPTLLEFIAENPIRRGSLPSNIADVAKVILEAGAKHSQASMDQTLGLVSSGRVARECRVQVPLIDLLRDYGANPNQAMMAALVHGEFEAVEALIRRGAAMDLPVAAATDRTEAVKQLLPASSAEQRHCALALAAQFGHEEVARLLLDAGVDPSRFNPVGCHAHSTPLHQAAHAGHLAVVKLLVEHGADLKVKDIMFQGTPLGWAEHANQKAVAEYLRSVQSG